MIMMMVYGILQLFYLKFYFLSRVLSNNGNPPDSVAAGAVGGIHEPLSALSPLPFHPCHTLVLIRYGEDTGVHRERWTATMNGGSRAVSGWKSRKLIGWR